MHICNPSIQKAEAGGSGIQYCPGPHSMTMSHNTEKKKERRKKGRKKKERGQGKWGNSEGEEIEMLLLSYN